MGIASSVGADVPYFLVGGRAYGEGYGEKLTAWPDDPAQAVLIAKPAASCSTAAMFRELDSTVRAWRDYTPGEHYNDFERVAPTESLQLIEQLAVEGATRTGLTGSGSAVYGLFSEMREASDAAKNLDAEFTWVGQTITRDHCFRVDTLSTGA
jgi:4-diphosphocytidyl-2-C-methyl-D-erythritol kinase